MRALIFTVLMFLGFVLNGCAHEPNVENNQQNQDSRHSVCIETDIFTDIVQQQMDQNGAGGKVSVNYCGPLADPHEGLGISLIETVLPRSDNTTQHSFFILKFAKTPQGWKLMAEPDMVVNFVQDANADATHHKPKTLSL